MSSRADFGVTADQDTWYFVVQPEQAGIDIFECRGSVQEPVFRLRLTLEQWNCIAPVVANEFDRQLRAEDRLSRRQQSRTWNQSRSTLVPRHFGMELLVLAWSIEDVAMSCLPAALANWCGLHPMERRWLYVQVNEHFGTPGQRGRGWRRAIQVALTENPV